MQRFLLTLAILIIAGTAKSEDILAGLNLTQLKKETGDINLAVSNNQKCVMISGKSGEKKEVSYYFSGSIMLPTPISLAGKTLKIIAASGNIPGSFYLRAYNHGENKPVWSFLSRSKILKSSPDEFTFTAGRDSILKWEPAMVNGQTANQVDRIQFLIGTAAGNTPVNVTISSIMAVPEVTEKEDKIISTGNDIKLTTDIKQVVSLSRKSILVNEQKANLIILHPDSNAGKTAATQIVESIRNVTGITVPAKVGGVNDWNPATHAIMLGNIYSNSALRVLYARKMTQVDEFLPGTGGYTLESVIEPFQSGSDIIVLGASDDNGLKLSATAFCNKVKQFGNKGNLEIPIIFETKYSAQITVPKLDKEYMEKGIAEARNILKDGIQPSLAGQLAAISNRYRLTRDLRDAKLYAEVARIYLASAKTDPRKFGGPLGMNSDFISYEAIAGWDLIEHDPVLSDQDRLSVSNMILHWLNEAIAAEAFQSINTVGPVSNHLTFASLGTLMGGFYYHKYYPKAVIQSNDWLTLARKVFRNQINYAKVRDESEGYQWLTWRHVMVYSLAFPDNLIVENGVGAKVMLACGVSMDNLGTQAPYGDDTNWSSSGSEFIVLNLYYALSHNNLAALLMEKKRPRFKIQPGTFYAKLNPKPETVLNGVKIIPLDKGFYDYSRAEGFLPPLDKTFDKFSFRENLNPESLYILVDGVNIGGHRHSDANSVLRYSQFEREWLAENGYILNQQKYHNSLLLFLNGESFPLPGLMELVSSIENDIFGCVTVRARQYGTTDWIRYYVWLKKNQAWLVIDEIDANKTGDYRLIQRWNGIGEIIPHSDGYLLEQKGTSVRFQTTLDAKLSTYDDNADLAQSWTGYPYASSTIRVMNQTIETKLNANSRTQMIAVWHGNGNNSSVSPWAIDRVNNGFTVNTGSELYTITANNPGDIKLGCKELSTKLTERKSSVIDNAKSVVPGIKEIWRDHQSQFDSCIFTNQEVAKVIKFKINGSEPAGSNPFIGSSPNKLPAVCDGAWTGGGDSVIYEQDQVVTIDFDFENAQQFNRVTFYLWWITASIQNTDYKLKTAELILSNDNFKNDVRRMPAIDAGNEIHTNSGTVEFNWNFEMKTARQIRLILTPQANAAIYLGEIVISGKPQNTGRLALNSELTKVVRVKDANGDYLAVGNSTGNLVIYSLDGKELSRIKLPAGINDIAVMDVDKDGEAELLLACRDTYLRAVKRNGKEIWKVKFDKYRVYPDVTIVKTFDINNDGEEEILAGCDNWLTYAFNRNGKELWRYEVIRPVRAVEIADIDGDGKAEILCGTNYMWATVLDNAGVKRWGGLWGVGCRAIAAPLNGHNKQRNVVIGTNDGKITFHNYQGKLLNSFIAGDEIFMMAVAKAKNDSEDVFVSSYNGYVYRFSADGKLIWSVPAPNSVVVVKALNNGGVVAGTIGGDVCFISEDGKILEAAKLTGQIADILVDGGQLRIVTQKGDIATLLNR